jgi:hypothetical protein
VAGGGGEEIAAEYLGMYTVVGMKMKRKRMELSGVIFVFIFLYGRRNEYRNTENKYKNEYFI